MYTLLKNITYCTNEYMDVPEVVCLKFTEKEVERLKHLIKVAKSEDVSIRMEFEPTEYLDLENNLDEEWSSDYSCIIIYQNSNLYFYAQNKYNSAFQIESESFNIDNILTNKNETES